MSLVATLQAVFAFVIFSETVIFGSLPFGLFSRMKNHHHIRDRLLGASNAFAGGLFLATGFIHLLGESAELMHEEFPEIHYPLTEVLSAVGFLGTFILEKVFFKNYSVHSHGGHDDNHNHTHDHDDHHHHHHHKNNENRKLLSNKPDSSSSSAVPLDSDSESIGFSSSESIFVAHETKTSDLAPYLLLIVLSLHSFLSGIAMGVQSKKSGLVGIAVAIIAHKWVESIAVGVSLLKMQTSTKKYWTLMISYALSEPLGIFVGSMIQFFVSEDASLTIESFVGAVASGTFIYVATIDILVEEFENNRDLVIKAVLALVGFGLMAALPIALHED